MHSRLGPMTPAPNKVRYARTFDEEIIERMGTPFYQQVFHPAIAQAFREDKKYEQIRDTIRTQWK